MSDVNITHKVRAHYALDVPLFGSYTEFVKLEPRVISAKWTKNNHLVADELTVTIGWREGGADPRALKNARGAFWLWDSALFDFDPVKHLRFTGIATKVQRRLGDDGWVVDITMQDYTSLFINHKPLKTSAMPEWADDIGDIWTRICDNTGWQDPDNGKIVSSVAALRDHLTFEDPAIEFTNIGSLCAKRFHAISKPQPKHYASSWDVWQWCICSLGLISYIDKDYCIVTSTTEHYKSANAARAIYGHNIHTLEETVDTGITTKGILLKSFDHLNNKVLEAFYPSPGDERLKIRRAAYGKNSEDGGNVTANEVSGDYEEFTNWSIQDQTALNNAAQQAYIERSKQEIEGSFHTSETQLFNRDGSLTDIFDVRAGDAISVEAEPENLDNLLQLGGLQAQIQYLVTNMGYDEDVATLIAKNINVKELRSPTFHVKELSFDLSPDHFDAEIKFHNLILVD